MSESVLTIGDLVQITQGHLAGRRGTICENSNRFSAQYGMWERTDEWGVERVYVVFDEIADRWEHVCEHGSIRMSRKWAWPRKTDIVKVEGDKV